MATSFQETPKIINERKAKALDALAIHLKTIKAELEKKKKLAKKHKHRHKKVDPVELIKKEISEQFMDRQRKAEIRKSAIKEEKMAIVERVLQQEYADSPPITTLQSKKKVKFEKDISLNECNEKKQTDEIPSKSSKVDLATSYPIAANAEKVSFLDMERDPSPIPPPKRRIPIPIVRAKPSRPSKKGSNTLAVSKKFPFEFDPPIVEFKDVLAGEKYEKQIRVINTTSSPRYFKFIGFSERLDDYAVIEMDPSSNMCSGAECFLKVEFSPTSELLTSSPSDLFLTFQSSCGTFIKVEFRFLEAKCCPSFHSVGGPNMIMSDFSKPSRPVSENRKQISRLAPLNAKLASPNYLKLNFEECVMGDKKKIWIRIINDGSIATAYYVDIKEPLHFSPSTTHLASGLKEVSEELFSEGPFVISQAAGQIGSYGSKAITISFEPIYDAEKSQADFGETNVSAVFQVVFQNQKEPFMIECIASTRALTLYPERQVIDFKTCLSEIFYQEKIQLWNRHKISRKFWVNTGTYPSVSNADVKVTTIPGIATIEFSPSIGFIQPNSSCYVWLKIKFHREALSKLGKSGKSFFETIQFGYLEQAAKCERYAPLILKALISDIRVSIKAEYGNDPFLLDFEELSIYERKQLTIRVTNPSKFPQMIQHNDKGIFKVTPHPGDISDTVFKIAPETSIRRSICFEPKNDEFYSERVCFKTTWNQDIFIQCQGKGVCPPAHFKNPLIAFQSLPFGNEDFKRVLLENTNQLQPNENLFYEFKKPILLSVLSLDAWTKVTIIDQLKTPDESRMLKLSEKDTDMLHVWPKSGIITVNEKISVEVLASVPPRSTTNQLELRKMIKADIDLSSIANLLKADKQFQKEKDPKDPKSKKDRSGVGASAKMKRDEAKKEGPNSSAVDGVDGNTSENTPFQKALFSTSKPVVSWLVPCVLKSIEKEQDRLKRLMNAESQLAFPNLVNEKSHTIYLKVVVPIIDSKLSLLSPESGTIDFPILPVGKKACKKITIQNVSTSTVQLSVVGISPHGPFYLSKALRPIPPNEKAEITIYFKPEGNAKFCDIAEFCSELCKIPIRLVGEGVSPVLKINHPDLVDMGDTCIGDTEIHDFEITNPSRVSITILFYMASTISSEFFSLNYSKKSPFSISTFRATLDAGETMKLSLSFAPDREHDNFMDYLCIKHDGQSQPRQIKIKGKGWGLSPVVLGTQDQPESFLAPPLLMSVNEEYEKVLKNVYDGNISGGSGETGKNSKEAGPLADILIASSKRVGHFVTISLEWKQILGTDLISKGYPGLEPDKLYWRIESKPVTIANLKPTTKGVDVGKKAAEYSIEKFDGTFEYDEDTKDYVLLPSSSLESYNCGLKMTLEPSKGTVDLGSKKQLELDIKDPSRLLLHKVYKTWDRIDNLPVPNLSTRFKANNDKSSILTLSVDCQHNQASEYKFMAQNYEIAEPAHIEQVFKIVFKNGIRFVDPKGPQFPEESRIFYLKIVAIPPSQENVLSV